MIRSLAQCLLHYLVKEITSQSVPVDDRVFFRGKLAFVARISGNIWEDGSSSTFISGVANNSGPVRGLACVNFNRVGPNKVLHMVPVTLPQKCCVGFISLY